jgi:MFS family permease
MSQPQPAAGIDKTRIFILSVIALVSTGMSFSLRSTIAEDLRTIFFDPIDKLNSGNMIGSVLGIAFTGYAITIPLGSALLDVLKMGLTLRICAAFLTLGTVMIMLAGNLVSGAAVYPYLWAGFLMLGLGWGLVEAVINPLTTTIYPEEKTHRLNVLHAWWPGGIIIGGLLGWALGTVHAAWQLKMAITLIPMVIFGIMSFVVRFPVTERAAAGVPMSAMFKEAFRPLYIILFIAMFGTAAAELAPGQWVDLALTRTVGMRGIWLLIYISGLMFVMRHFAGAVVHRLNPIGLMWVSCLLAAVGLFMLGNAHSPVAALIAATFWGAGVCFMWPTMYAITSEQFPKGGAFLMGLVGAAGCLSISFVLPQMGRIFDWAKVKAAGGGDAFKALSGVQLEHVLGTASQLSVKAVAVLPAALLIVFGVIWLYFRAKGGYKPIKIAEVAVETTHAAAVGKATVND